MDSVEDSTLTASAIALVAASSSLKEGANITVSASAASASLKSPSLLGSEVPVGMGSGLLSANTHVPKELLSSVIKIFCIKTEPNYSMPWQMKRQASSTGSGFVISERRIMTNAHCVANQTSVRVRKHGSPDKFIAKVLAVGHACDLAILTVDDESFWEGLNPLEFGGIPYLQEAVTTVGYPTGGDNISVTKGVVSRVEETYYSHGCARLLAIQVDAAINPGNSGGPALMGGRVVGVCFETLTNAENIGYIIPVPVIMHFLADINRDVSKRGFCDLGMQVQQMESEGLRRSLGLGKGDSGLLVNKVAPLSGASKVLQKDDVIFAIEGVPIGNDGTIPFRDSERVSYRYQLLSKFVGDKIGLSIKRNGRNMDVEVELATYPYLVPVQQHDILPSYFIFAGFVFQVLTQPYLQNEWGKEWKKKAPIKLVDHHMYHLKEHHDQELIVISQILVSDINVGYSTCAPSMLTHFNGTEIRNLKHLVSLVEEVKEREAQRANDNNDDDDCPDGADEANKAGADYMRFELEDGRVMILNTQEAIESSLEILKQQNIPFDKSHDLKAKC